MAVPDDSIEPLLSREPSPSPAPPPLSGLPILDPEVVAVVQSLVEVTINNRLGDTPPTGMNKNDVVAYAIASEERTRRLERLIWTTTGILALGVGSASILCILVLHEHIAGSIGLATATIAGVSTAAAKIWRRFSTAGKTKKRNISLRTAGSAL